MPKLFPFIPDEVPNELKGLIKSIPEEIGNMISHGVGLIFFLIGIPLLLLKTFENVNTWVLIACSIFSISLLMVYTSSTIYHSVYKLYVKKSLRVFDHISIYFLISGTFTPFLLIHLQTNTGWLVLGILWSMVFLGSVFKYFYTHEYKLVSTLAYVAMGGIVIFVINPISEIISSESLNWLIIGGVSYLIGVPFYLWKRLYFNHLIWHLFVLGGSISHFLAVWYLIV